MRIRPVAVVVALLAVLAASLPAAASSGDQFSSPRKYYLSLGDSLAFGYQQATFNAIFPNEDPAAFHTGYANDFAALLREVRHNVRLVNYGCPGETTDSFLNGPCPYPFALHNPYTKSSQLGTAVDFLHSHPDQVSPITIDIGSNDANHALIPICISPASPACQAAVQALLGKLSANLTTILATLHAAAPRSEIIVLNLYNGHAIDVPGSDAIASLLDQMIEQVATGQGARVADVFSAFNPQGPTEVPTLCAFTALCTSLQDGHPSDAGYLVMALKVLQASGFERED